MQVRRNIFQPSPSVWGLFRLTRISNVHPNRLVSFFDTEVQAITGDQMYIPSKPIRANHFVAIIAATIKHSAFREEKEWRLLLSRGERKLKYRTRGSLLVPYVEQMFGDNLKALLAEVIVGPSTHKEQTAEAIKGLLAENGFTSTEVRLSETPYRGF